MDKEKKIEIVIILIAILGFGLIIHSIFKRFNKNKNTENHQTNIQTQQTTNNTLTV